MKRKDTIDTMRDLEETLTEMRENGMDKSHGYILLWRRYMRISEELYRHPY